MRFSKNKGIVLVTVLVFVLLLTLIAGVSLSLFLNQVKLLEYQIKRIKAYYAAEAGLVAGIEDLRKANFPTNNKNYTVGEFSVTVNRQQGGGIDNTDILSSTVNYTP